jgi:hypothetical protein
LRVEVEPCCSLMLLLPLAPETAASIRYRGHTLRFFGWLVN